MQETIRAIRLSHKIAEKLTEDYPSEIIEMYRSMKTCEEIARELELTDHYGITMKIALTALSTALRELIHKDEMKILWRKHLSQAALKKYKLYGSTLTIEDRKKGSDIYWRNISLEEKKQRMKHLYEAKGTVLWSDNETVSFIKMYLGPHYANENGKPNYKAIAKDLNKCFHKGKKVRTVRTLTIKKNSLIKNKEILKNFKSKEYKPFFQKPISVHHLLLTKYSKKIVMMYRNMNTLEEIANKLNLANNYRISLSSAKTYVYLALHDLIPKKEMEALFKKHLSQAGKKKNRLYGCNLTSEDGKKGAATYWNNTNKKQRTLQSHKAIIAKGQVPWTKKETRAFFSMSEKTKYQHRTGRRIRKPNFELIAQELNYKFHQAKDIRTSRSLTVHKYNLKRTGTNSI